MLSSPSAPDSQNSTYSSCGRINSSGIRKPRHLEWIVSLDGDNRISYSLDGQQLTRKVKLGGSESKQTEQADAAEGASAYSLLLSLEAHRFQIKSKRGAILDEFTDGQHDWSRARIGIKGDALFLVRATP